MHKKICCYCHKEYVTRKKKQKYCSPDCQHNAVSLIMKKEKPIAICKYCGKEFEYSKRKSNGIYCSKECCGKDKINNANKYKQIYYNDRQNIKRLSVELTNELQRLKQRYDTVKKQLDNIKQCKVCDSFFMAKNKHQLYCSIHCRNKHHNRYKDKRIYRNGKPDLSITLTKLYMRDNGICQLCGRHIDFDCDSNSKHYPSIDHIKPIAKGGTHTWDNVQLACRQCNSIKSDSF